MQPGRVRGQQQFSLKWAVGKWQTSLKQFVKQKADQRGRTAVQPNIASGASRWTTGHTAAQSEVGGRTPIDWPDVASGARADQPEMVSWDVVVPRKVVSVAVANQQEIVSGEETIRPEVASRAAAGQPEFFGRAAARRWPAGHPQTSRR